MEEFESDNKESTNIPEKVKISSLPKQTLSSCTWAATSFYTRSNQAKVNDGKRRLKEWTQHQLNVGFDHVYVFDNSGAFTNDDDLKDVTSLFGSKYVTRIPWPAQVCNNNLARKADKGERSSQYAADATCRIRFGAQSKWISFLDTDEYLIPMNKTENLKDVVEEIGKKDEIKIINFYSARAKPRFELMDIMEDGSPMPKESSSFLEAYNCEREMPPKTFWMPAEKQIYRPDYVYHHFIHYPTASKQSLLSKRETNEMNLRWRQRHNEAAMGNSRWVNELTEATMIHTKAVTVSEISANREVWTHKCKQSSCHFGFAWSQSDLDTLNKKQFLELVKDKKRNEDGFVYNCWPNAAANKWSEMLKKSLVALKSTKDQN